jgi:membrane peptidoglycan carboxypeptidase
MGCVGWSGLWLVGWIWWNSHLLKSVYMIMKMKRFWGSVRRFFLWSSAILLLGSLFALVALYVTVLADLPSVDAIEARSVRPTTRILDRHGRLLYEVLDPNAGKQFSLALAPEEGRSQYGLANVPDFCVEATLATEDSRFFLHPGFDPVAIARAAWQNYRAGGQIVSGGSTLTQQVARNLLMDPDERYQRTLRRKIREAWLAFQLERRYAKAQILQLYLNQTYYGHFAFGLEAAAQNFFAKPAEQLSRAECALLAGLVQYPSGYNPILYPEAARLRQQTVLRLMTAAGYIDATEVEAVAAEVLRYRSRLFNIEAPHFVMYVQERLLKTVGADRLRDGGLEVWTTLDLGLQRQAEASVRQRLAQLNCGINDVPGHAPRPRLDCEQNQAERQIRNAAAVVLDVQSGEILAMVGSPDYFDASIQGNLNAALSLRQPGSAIKPFTYAAALDPQWNSKANRAPLTPASILPDLPRAFPGGRGNEAAGGTENSRDAPVAYLPKNYDLRYRGPVSVREALANSYNIPAVHVLEQIGVSTLQQLATAAGISSFTGEYGLALTLGGGEVSLLDLTAAYAIFPRGGKRLETRAIVDIRDLRAVDAAESTAAHLTNLPISQSPDLPVSPPEVISPEAAYLITDILADPVARIPAFGERSVLNMPFPAAVKTGTTTDWRDNWTVGYSRERLVGVWVGNADNTPMRGISGIDGAGPIWHDLMRSAHSKSPAPFRRPARILELTICAPSGLLPTAACPRLRQEHFIVGAEPTRPDDQFQRIAIDRATGLRASADTPAERVVQRVYWILGPQFADWMQAQGIPQPPPLVREQGLAAASPGGVQIASTQPAGAALQSLVLTAPNAAGIYAIHPGVPRERQRIPLGGYVTGGERWHALRLMVDGEALLSSSDVARLDGWWSLEPGEHTFWLEGEAAENASTVRSAAVMIVVQ